MNYTTENHQLVPGTFQLIRDDGLGEVDRRPVVFLDPIPSKDPNDPLNWSTVRKAVNFGLISAVTATVFTALSIQIIFWQQMSIDLKLTYTQLNRAVSVNLVGLATGCLLFIPFARKLGRRPIYLVSTAVIAGVAFWTANMRGMSQLYATNLLFGLAGATNEAIVQITIADISFVHHRGTLNGIYLTMVMIGSFVAPMAAGTQATNMGWRSCYYTLGGFGAGLFILFLFFYEETKFRGSISGIESRTRANISSDNADLRTNDFNVQKKSKDNNFVDIAEDETLPNPTGHEIDHIIPMNSLRQRLAFYTYSNEPIVPHLWRPLVILTTFPHVLFTGLQYASGVIWLTIMSSVLGQVLPLPPYNFTPAEIGFMSAGPFIGNLIGSAYGGFLGDRSIVWFARRNKGLFEPEMRLYILHLPALCMSGGILMFGISLSKGQHWIIPSIGGALFGFGLGSIGDASLTFIIDSYTDVTGDAFTGIAFLRNAMSIWVPFTITPWMMQQGLQSMFITCGFVSLVISALCIPMAIYGKRIRASMAPTYRRYAKD